jgi:hypothetical protein
VLAPHRRTEAGREAIGRVVEWAQGELGLHRIELHTFPENAPTHVAPRRRTLSVRVSCATTPSNGRFVDNIVYAPFPASPPSTVQRTHSNR